MKLYERYLERIWLDHFCDWPSRGMHPLENMPDYGREITNIVSTVSLMLCLDDPRHEHLPPEQWQGPPFKGENNGWKSEGYHRLNGPTWIGEALAARLLGAKGYWNHNAFFDYVDRWVEEADRGTVDRQTLRPTGYDAFHGTGDFVKAMWQAYRASSR